MNPEGAEWQGRFRDLDKDVLECILSHLPATSMHVGRLVNTEWNKIISSPKFFRELWMKRRPKETWVYLFNAADDVMFYDSLNNVSYDWNEDHNPITPLFQLPCASANGLIFGYGYDVDYCTGGGVLATSSSKGKIWAWNPLTGKSRELPAMVNADSLVLTLSAVASGAGTGSGSSYLLLVTSFPCSRASSAMAMTVEMYCSDCDSWQVLTESLLFMYPVVVPRFRYEDGKIVLWDRCPTPCGSDFSTERSGRIDIHQRFVNVAVFCTDKRRWAYWLANMEGPGSPKHRRSSWCMLFERDGHLVVFVVDRDCSLKCLGAQIWTKPLMESLQCPWTLLAAMPEPVFTKFCGDDRKERNRMYGKFDDFRLRVAADCAAPECRETHSQDLRKMQYQERIRGFPVADSLNGDRLVLMSIFTHEIVSFNFAKPPSQAWTSLTYLASLSASPGIWTFPPYNPGADSIATQSRVSFSRDLAADSHSKILKVLGSNNLSGFAFQPSPEIYP